jgi:hypothetical protein
MWGAHTYMGHSYMGHKWGTELQETHLNGTYNGQLHLGDKNLRYTLYCLEGTCVLLKCG